VFALDADPLAPALQDADEAQVVSSIYDPGYVDDVLSICKQHDIKLLISLNDLELPVLADRRKQFEALNVALLVSDERVIDICGDKMLTVEFLLENGFDTPKTFLSLEKVKVALDAGEVEFPLMVKPRWGSASLGLTKVHSLEELEWAFNLTQLDVARGPLARAGLSRPEEKALSAEVNVTDDNVIVQEWIDGSEYGLDVLNNLNQSYECVYAKQKLGMRAGETDKAVLATEPRLQAIGEKLGSTLGHVGNLDVDVFLTEDRAVVLELNPRFGGGYPFSHELGARYPQALLAWARGEAFDSSIQVQQLDTVVTKCDRLLVVS